MAYPNPAKDKMTFRVRLETAAEVELRIYNLAGELVFKLAEELPEGEQSLAWNDCRQVAAGLYIVQCFVDGQETGKIKIAIIR